MINFRFHLVSLVAVFLALAIGVVAGGALGQPTVDTLQSRIDTVEANAEQRRAENEELRAELDRADGAIDEGSEFAVTDRLDERARLRRRGARRRRGSGEPDRHARPARRARPLREWSGSRIDGRCPSGTTSRRWPRRSASRRPAVGRRCAATGWDALAARLAEGAPTSGADPLRALADAGFVTVAGVGCRRSAARPDRRAEHARAARHRHRGRGAAAPGHRALCPRRARPRGTARRGEAFPDDTEGADRGDALEGLRSNEALTERVSTVDNLERTQGSVAAVLALADLDRGIIGHYGSGRVPTAAAGVVAEVSKVE